MTPSERDKFVVAFVLFVVGHFLAPRGLGEHTNTEVFHALANPSPTGSGSSPVVSLVQRSSSPDASSSSRYI